MRLLILTVLALAGASGFAASSSSAQAGGSRVAVLTKPPGDVPSQRMSGGPLLGNGDVGVTMGGQPEEQRYYIGKNDFWTRVDPHVLTVGHLTLSIPSLKGASYRMDQDMNLAEMRGIFSKGAATIQTRSWVDANENLLLVELRNTAGPATEVSLSQWMGEPLFPVNDNANHLNIGREQFGGGRWYFQGEIVDASVLPHALTAGEIEATAREHQPGSAGKSFNGKTDFEDRAAPAIRDAVTVSAWIKVKSEGPEPNYIVSKGEWNKAYSLGLVKGSLCRCIDRQRAQAEKPLELDKWIYVAGVFDGQQMCAYADGKLVARPDGGVVGSIDRSLGIATFTREADPTPGGREVTVASRFLDTTPASNSQGELTVTLSPGATVTLATAIRSDLDARDDRAAALKRVSELRGSQIAQLTARHREWWTSFWARSFIEIPDKVIEQHWYAALYILGSCSRAGKVAPGLWGNWVTTDSSWWHGDFHLNYNFQAPYYIAYSSNHADLTAPYYQAILESVPGARATAQRNGWKGVHLPACIGPWGLFSEGPDRNLGQHSDAAFAGINFIWQYQYTQDRDFLRTSAYPYLREVADFWEDYLKLENGRYVDYNDSIHEDSGPDVNPLFSLGLLRTIFKNLISMSEVLNVDTGRRAKWQDICDKLSPFPLQQRNGKTVFRYSEKGTAWWDGNTLGVYPIFPADAIGLDSDPKLLQICSNTVDEMHRWADYNGFTNWYTACARIGYDPKTILTKLRAECDHHSFPSLLLYYGGGGVECCGGFLAIDEMLLQSHEGVIRLFPDWPKDEDARFGDLRAVGAFLVSAEIKGGQIGAVKIRSEKGMDCAVVNPWPGRKVALVKQGNLVGTLQGERFTFKTSAGETAELKAL